MDYFLSDLNWTRTAAYLKYNKKGHEIQELIEIGLFLFYCSSNIQNQSLDVFE